MKKISSLLSMCLMFIVAIAFTSCDDPELTVTGGASFDENGVELTNDIKVIAEHTGWSVSVKKGNEWLSASKNGNKVSFYAKENPTLEEREAVVLIEATEDPDLNHSITIRQKKKIGNLSVSPSSISLSAEGGSKSFQIKSNIHWTITGTEGWLTVTPSSGDNTQNVIVQAGENSNTKPNKCNLTVTSDDGSFVQTVTVEQAAKEVVLLANGSTNTTLNFGAKGGESQQVNVTSNVSWSVTNTSEWVRVSPNNGNGNSTLTITVNSENFSDESRTANIQVKGGGATATIVVSQDGVLGKNLRVGLSNLTVMCDGFAADLSFPKNAKGYKEAFFTESAYKNLTERDLYNMLMEETEMSGSLDWTYLPTWVDPGTTIVYCIAAYGNENNEDGSHKYGPMTMEKITTKQMTIYDDMLLDVSYTRSEWKVNATRSGQYGQRCDEYYYLAAEDEYALNLYNYSNTLTYAFLAHFFYEPMIKENPNTNYKYGPQVMTWRKEGSVFFISTWGKDRDTKKFSSELSWEVGVEEDDVKQQTRKKLKPSEWNKPRHVITRAELEKLRSGIRIYRAK